MRESLEVCMHTCLTCLSSAESLLLQGYGPFGCRWSNRRLQLTWQTSRNHALLSGTFAVFFCRQVLLCTFTSARILAWYLLMPHIIVFLHEYSLNHSHDAHWCVLLCVHLPASCQIEVIHLWSTLTKHMFIWSTLTKHMFICSHTDLCIDMYTWGAREGESNIIWFSVQNTGISFRCVEQ